MCDNCRQQKTHFDATDKLRKVLKLVAELGEKFDDVYIINIMMGIDNQLISSYDHNKIEDFGSGKEDGLMLWKSLLRQAVLNNYLSKDIDNYGLLKLTKSGKAFIQNPFSVKFILNKPIESADDEPEEGVQEGSGSLDTQLLQMLKDLRRKVAKLKNLPPFVIFQDPSLEEMCTHYPVTLDELKQIHGVGSGKALKFGPQFVELIKKYVEENDIDRPVDLIIKSAANKSAIKVSIIQNIDRQIALDDIASSKGLSYEDILREVESIVNSGTKLNLNYYIDELIDEDRQDEVFDYFRNTEIDSVDKALQDLGSDDYTREELQLMRVKFLSELGN
jgi:ATP-dependent DNA helicase RecQ